MSVRLVSREVAACDAGRNQCHAKIYYNTEYKEYRVKFYVHTAHQNQADYFTDSLDDAKQTAAVQCWAGFEDRSI